MMNLKISPLSYIQSASETIKNTVNKTPLTLSTELTKRLDAPCFLKLEIFQPTRSFKIRGAANKILNLSGEEQKQGIIAVSTGNHGRAVAFIAKELGIKATICISNRVPANKVKSLKELGANLVIHGQSQDDAERRANDLMQEYGYALVHPFDDPYIIAGQGTIGLEILEDLPDVDTVIVPVSGGGLISGIVLAIKAINPKIRVIGVSMQSASVMYHSLQAGNPIELPEEDTLADSLLGGIGLNNQYTFSVVQDFVDDLILVSEEEIAQAMAFALHEEHLVVEGAGTVGIAALLNQRIKVQGSVVSIVSGGNVDIPTLLNIAQEYRS